MFGPATTDGTTIWIEFFLNPSCVGTANGAGATYYTFVPVDLPAGETSAPWSAQLGGLTDGEGVTATSTNTLSSDTSTFSICATVQGNSPGTGSLFGSVSLTGGQNIDLTAAGSEDWAIWGSANGGTNTSLAPNVRKNGASAISDLTDIDPTAAPRRGLGQFPSENPFTFDWSDGNGPFATGVFGGLQHDGTSLAPTVGDGFSLTVPADTTDRTLTLYTTAHWASGTLIATLSDGSAPAFSDQSVSSCAGCPNQPGIYTIRYAAAHAEAQLTVTFTENAGVCGGVQPPFCDNVAVYAATLATTAITGVTTNLKSGANIGMSGSNDALARPSRCARSRLRRRDDSCADQRSADQRAPDQRVADQRSAYQRPPDQRFARLTGCRSTGCRSTGFPSTVCPSTACRSMGYRSTGCR